MQWTQVWSLVREPRSHMPLDNFCVPSQKIPWAVIKTWCSQINKLKKKCTGHCLCSAAVLQIPASPWAWTAGAPSALPLGHLSAPASTSHLAPGCCPSAGCSAAPAPPALRCLASPSRSPPPSAAPPAAGVARWPRARIFPAVSAGAPRNSGGRRPCPCWEAPRKLWMSPSPSPWKEEKRRRGVGESQAPSSPRRSQPSALSENPQHSPPRILHQE